MNCQAIKDNFSIMDKMFELGDFINATPYAALLVESAVKNPDKFENPELQLIHKRALRVIKAAQMCVQARSYGLMNPTVDDIRSCFEVASGIHMPYYLDVEREQVIASLGA